MFFCGSKRYICEPKNNAMNKNTTLSIGGNYGLISGLLLSSITLLIHIVGQEKIGTGLSTILSLGVLLVFMLLSVNKFISSNSGYARFGQAFKVALTTAAVAALVSGAYMVLHTTVIVPDFQEIALSTAEESILKSQPDATQEQIDLAISMAKKFTSPVFMGIGGFFGVILPGLFFALLLAAFLKKDPPFDFDNQVIDKDTI